MRKPITLLGWFQALGAMIAAVVALGGAAWGVTTTVATKDELRAVEIAAVQSITTLRCDLLDRSINDLVRKRESEGLSPREKARLESLLLEWDRVCSGSGS